MQIRFSGASFVKVPGMNIEPEAFAELIQGSDLMLFSGDAGDVLMIGTEARNTEVENRVKAFARTIADRHNVPLEKVYHFDERPVQDIPPAEMDEAANRLSVEA